MSLGTNLHRRLLLKLAAMSPLVPVACTTALAAQKDWAKPVTLAGVPNLHEVGGGLYRSGQPTVPGFWNLRKALGLHSVVNLRNLHSDKRLVWRTGLALFEVPMKAYDVDDDDSAELVKALATIRRELPQGPLLVHCQHGADRTGVVIALWRMLEQGWTAAEAMNEMINGSLGFHVIWKNIPDYLAHVDIEALRARVLAG